MRPARTLAPFVMVDFFIAGVQKGGTTALDSLLREEQLVQMASRKEPHYFDDESVDWRAPDYTAYHLQFWPNAEEGKIRGEATPIYSYWPAAIERIAAYNPNARVILLLRHPTFRAHSHWRMESKRGNETLSFKDAIRPIGRSRVKERGASDRIYSYVERGFYEPQVERLLHLFPREQLLFIRTDDLWSRAGSTISSVYEFLGIATGKDVDDPRYVVPLDSSDQAVLCESDRQYLDNIFRDEITKTAALTMLDLRDWLLPSYAEPMGNGARLGGPSANQT